MIFIGSAPNRSAIRTRIAELAPFVANLCNALINGAGWPLQASRQRLPVGDPVALHTPDFVC
jgi:hypothetical protein